MITRSSFAAGIFKSLASICDFSVKEFPEECCSSVTGTVNAQTIYTSSFVDGRSARASKITVCDLLVLAARNSERTFWSIEELSRSF